jgi:hypothetical protein
MAVTLTMETGAGIPAANAYQDEALWKAWADQRLYVYTSFSSDQVKSSLVRGAQWLDTTYRVSWPGVRTFGPAGQGLLWPRKAGRFVNGVFVNYGPLATVVDSEGNAIPVNAIPIEMKLAQNEAAWRELVSPGSLAPDLDRGGAIKSLKAGSVGIEYFGSASAMTTFVAIDAILAGLITGSETSEYTARAVRA